MKTKFLLVFTILGAAVVLVMLALPGERRAEPPVVATGSLDTPTVGESPTGDAVTVPSTIDQRLIVKSTTTPSTEKFERPRSTQQNPAPEQPTVTDALDTTRYHLKQFVEMAYPVNPDDPYVAYDRAKELLYWKDYCDGINRAIRNISNERQDVRHDDLRQLQSGAAFCEGAEQFAESLDEMQIPEHEMPYSVVAKYPELEVMDGESADRFVARELDRALDQGAFLTVSDLVNARLMSFDDLKMLSIPSMVNVMDAVAVYLFCQRHGGCIGTNALVLRVCYNPDVYCIRPPRDLYDALDQRLSGAEREAFNKVVADFERLLANVN
ncbi:MAG: hypothetical protein Kow0020_07240 [Wenzhouxiangellaceae bacterium]